MRRRLSGRSSSAALAGLLAGSALLVIASTGLGAAGFKPDALIKLSNNSHYKGNGIYNDTGRRQTVGASAEPGHSRAFNLKFQNDGGSQGTLEVKGCDSAHHVHVSYIDPDFGENVTGTVTHGTYRVILSPGASTPLKLRMAAGANAEPGDRRVCRITGSDQMGSASDTVKANLVVAIG